MILFLLPAVLAFALTFAMGRLLCIPYLAEYFRDNTGGKKLHHKVVPASGGIALFVGILGTALIFEGGYLVHNYLYFILALTAMFLLGLLDDLKPLGWLAKLICQLFIISFVVVLADLRLQSVLLEHSFYHIPYPVSIILTIVLLTFLTNAFNFIDGIDGLATTVALLFTLGILYFQIPFSSIFIMCLGASLFAFRRFNKEPAALFMGDSGSLFLGFFCAGLLVIFLEADLSTANTRLNSYQQRLPMAIALFWYPVFDTIRVLSIRLVNGKSVFERDKLHSYSLLLRLGYSHTQIVGLVAFFTLIQAAMVFLLEPVLGFAGIFILLVVFWIGIHFYIGYLVKKFKTGKLN